jgi:effector-binding domain-containing protein
MKLTEPKVEYRDEQPYMGIRTQVTMEELSKVIPQLIDEMFTWMAVKEITPAGAPILRYYVIDMAGQLDIEIGLPVADKQPGDERVKPAALPAGRYAALVYTGVENGIQGNAALLDWGAKQGLVWDQQSTARGDAFGGRYETLIDGPEDKPDPDQWDTEVAIRLADGA